VSETGEFFEGFVDDYFPECEEHLTGAARALLALEEAMGDPPAERTAIDELFRLFHTLKGISAMVELKPAEELAHHLEHYLRAIREREVFVSADGIELLIQGTQRLEQIIGARKLGQPQPAFGDVIARVTALVPTAGATPTASSGAAPAGRTASSNFPHSNDRRWICTFAPTRELLADGVGVDSIRRRLTEVGTIVQAVPEVRPDGAIAFQFTLATPIAIDAVEVLKDLPLTVTAADEAAPSEVDLGSVPAAGAERPATAAPTAHVVRVDLARLDELMRNVGDLVISRARLTDTLGRLEGHLPSSEWRAVHDNAVVIDRQLRTLREGIMRVRLVPIGEIFRRMPFVVRDLARESGKKITLDLQGQSTEIDKYLIERMMDPVLHLVRNAVSHGIEDPAVRIASGKRPEGTIRLAATTAGEIVTIEVADDGRGVDANAVAARARAAGLPVPAGTPDPATLLALLCAPGFSTKDDADRASGRGVGMAVVKQTIEQLSGTMTLETEPGVGTRFLLQLPLTLAIADALIGRVGDESFAIPQSAVREVIEVSSADVRLIEQNEIVPYRDGALPIVRLGRLFGIPGESLNRFHAFVVGSGAAVVGLAVDRIVGQREIVVRAISDPLVRVDGVSGATDLGDGRVVLILDPAKLTHRLAPRRPVGAVSGRAGGR
jgi:two-component system chemotaxis sensor kinase CheA